MKSSFHSARRQGLRLALLLAAALHARAQDAPPIMVENLAGQMAMTHLLFENTTGRIASDKASNRSSTTKSLAYVPTPTLKQKIVQGYVSRLKTRNSAAAQTMAAHFGLGKYDYGTIYRGMIAGYNLHENDAVDAMTAYLVLGWR